MNFLSYIYELHVYIDKQIGDLCKLWGCLMMLSYKLIRKQLLRIIFRNSSQVPFFFVRNEILFENSI